MAHTHLNLLYHIIFSTKNREPWLMGEIKERIYPYMAATLRNFKAETILINGVPDHVHILCRLRATHSVAEVVRTLKRDTSVWVRKSFRRTAFAWQEGYGAFTVGASQKKSIHQYIAQQEEHHRKSSFQEEYLTMLKKSGIKYDERFVWG